MEKLFINTKYGIFTIIVNKTEKSQEIFKYKIPISNYNNSNNNNNNDNNDNDDTNYYLIMMKMIILIHFILMD